MTKLEKSICEECGKTCDELVTRQGFCITYHITWICEKCFKKLEGVSFDDYNKEHFYGEGQEGF